ncbi:MAG: TlpA family protein disulfide reductase [Chloroflexi bacterium]|nr:TlpA family protein disulfide reductase [Chloroflexota bacterium]MCC6895163.1 TlpA family protein disulfide reductase [Anaerolineae bacterium]
MTEIPPQTPAPRGAPSPILLVFLFIPLLGIVAAVALAISDGVVGGQPLATPQAVPSNFVSLVGDPAPDFVLAGMDGQQHRLSEYKGHVTFVNFWATWCVPCRIELPALMQVAGEQGTDGAQVLAVNVGESGAQIDAYFTENHISGLTVLLDSNVEVYSAFGINALPTTFVVDKDGVIRYRHFGMITLTDVQAYIDKLAT